LIYATAIGIRLLLVKIYCTDSSQADASTNELFVLTFYGGGSDRC